MRMGDQWLPRKPLASQAVTKQQQQIPHKPTVAPTQPQLANDDFGEDEDISPSTTQPLPSLAARLRLLRSPWERQDAHSDPNSNNSNNNNNKDSQQDLDIEDDEPPITTRSLWKMDSGTGNGKGKGREPPLKRARVNNNNNNTDHNTSIADDIDETDENTQPDSGFIVKSFFGGRNNLSDSIKRKPPHRTIRDEGSDDDIEQGDAEEEVDKDRRDTNFLMGLVSPFKSLPVYNNRDPIVDPPKPAPARRLMFVEAKTKEPKKEIKEEIKEEQEDIEETSDDLGSQRTFTSQRSGRSLLMRNTQPSQSSDTSQSLASSQHSTASNYSYTQRNNHTAPNNYYYNSNNNNNNNSTNSSIHSDISNTQTVSDAFIPRRRPVGDDAAQQDDIIDPHERGSIPATFKPLMRRDDIEDVADSSPPDDVHFVKREPTDDEEIEERNSTAWRDGEKDNIRTKLLHLSPKPKPTGSTRSQWLESIAASSTATQATPYTGNSPKFVRNGLSEKVVRVMKQHFLQHQHLYASQQPQQQSQQHEKLQMVVLHELSKIQPHVNVVLSLLVTEGDLTELNNVDVTQEEGAFLKSHEPVYVVYANAAALDMKLQLGSIVILEHWQEIHLPGYDKRTILSFKATSPCSVFISPEDPFFISFMRQLQLSALNTATSSTPPSSTANTENRVSVTPVYPTINSDAMDLVQTSDSPTVQLTPPPKPSLTPLDKLHPLSENFTIEAIVQRCFFREFSTPSGSNELACNSTSTTPTKSNTSSSKQPTKPNNTPSTVTSLCDIMKKRMSLSQRNAQSTDTPSSTTQVADASQLQIRKCSVLLQDASGATAELVIPDEYASDWKDLFIEGEGLKFALENLQVVKKESLASGSPLQSVLSSLKSHSHVLLSVVKSSTFRRVFEDADASMEPTSDDVSDVPRVSYSPEPICDVQTLLDGTQAGKRVSLMGKIMYVDQSYKPTNLLSTTFCTLNVFDGSVDSTYGVNNVGVFVRGAALTSLVTSRIVDVGTVVRIKGAICNASSSTLDTDNYTTVEKIRLPFSPSTSPSLVPVAPTGQTLSSRRKIHVSKAPPTQQPSNASSTSPNTLPHPTQAHNLVYHNSLARLLEVPFSDLERLGRLQVEADFAELSPQNYAAVREKFRHCLVYLRGSIKRHIEEVQYIGCSSCFQELSSPVLSDEASFCSVCSQLQPVTQCVAGTFGVAVGNNIEAQLKVGYEQLRAILSTLPQPIDLQTFLANNKLPKLYAQLQKHSVHVPCHTFDGKTFHCASVKGAEMCLV